MPQDRGYAKYIHCTTRGGAGSRSAGMECAGGVARGCLLVFRIKKTRHRTHVSSEQLIRAIKGRAGLGVVGVRVGNVKCHRVITVNKRNGKSQSWEILDRAGRVKKQEAMLSGAVFVIQIFAENQKLFIDFIDG